MRAYRHIRVQGRPAAALYFGAESRASLGLRAIHWGNSRTSDWTKDRPSTTGGSTGGETWASLLSTNDVNESEYGSYSSSYEDYLTSSRPKLFFIAILLDEGS